MPFPSIITRPVFHILYRFNRRASPIPPIQRVVRDVTADQRVAFETLIAASLAQGANALIDYHLSYPKVDFLNYLCDWQGYVAHGTPRQDLSVLQPVRLSTDSGEFGNRQQIFCSPDGVWAMWFAILDKSKFRSTRNGCVRQGHGAGRVKYYHFELPTVNRAEPPFTDGMLYLARPEDFPHHRQYPMLVHFDAEIEEWGSVDPVTPLARLPVSPHDFPYLDKVQFIL